MPAITNELALIRRLADRHSAPKLSNDELESARAYLAEMLLETPLGAPVPGTVELRRLESVIAYNKHLRSCSRRDIPSSACPDARVLLRFIDEAGILTQAIDELHTPAIDARDSVLSQARSLVIFCAGYLKSQVTEVRAAIGQQGLLTSERKDILANLSKAIDYIQNILHVSIANNWGYRVTSENAPAEVAEEWAGQWRILRHAAIQMEAWAEGMGENAKIDPKVHLNGILTDAMRREDWSYTVRRLSEETGIPTSTIGDDAIWKKYHNLKKSPDAGRGEVHVARAKLSDPDKQKL